MLARIREVVMEKSAVIHSRRLLKQLSAFGEDDHGHMEALAGRDDLLFAWGIGLMSRSENYFKAIPDQGGSSLMPDWEALGIHVRHPELPNERIRRLMAMDSREPTEKSYLEL